MSAMVMQATDQELAGVFAAVTDRAGQDHRKSGPVAAKGRGRLVWLAAD
jgi:hypothetical protein